MSEFKIAGCCTTCDKKLFEVLDVFEAHHPRAGEPKRLGKSIEGACRITFGLYDGTHADFSFCKECGDALDPSQYQEIWNKALRSFIREGAKENPEHRNWFLPMFANGLLVHLGTVSLKEIEGRK